MAIKYREHIDADGVHREWTDANGVVHRELMTQRAEFIESHQFTWDRSGLREERNAYLSSTDYLLLEDVGLSAEQKEQVIEYRQKLRDLPQDYPELDDAKEALQTLKPQDELSWL